VWALQQSLLLVTSLWEGAEERNTTINLGLTPTTIAKRELRLWLKANPNSHAIKDQESKLKKLLKMIFFGGNYKSSTYVCACQGGCALILEKNRPRAPIVGKMNAAELLEGFRRLVGYFSPPVRLQIDHSTQLMGPPPSQTLNIDITLVELFQAMKKL